MLIGWHEQNERDVPPDDNWLGTSELAVLARMRFAKRRADWRLGRWTAKWAVSAWLGLPASREALRELEIRPAPSGAPEVFSANRSAAVTVSLSHRSGLAVCAVASTCRAGPALGCDIERIEPHSDLFLADYFTIEEQTLVREAPFGDRWRLLALLWSAKESLLKALRLGLRVDARSVNVTPELPLAADGIAWHPLRVRYAEIGAFCGWWRESAGFIRTLVAVPLSLRRSETAAPIDEKEIRGLLQRRHEQGPVALCSVPQIAGPISIFAGWLHGLGGAGASACQPREARQLF